MLGQSYLKSRKLSFNQQEFTVMNTEQNDHSINNKNLQTSTVVNIEQNDHSINNKNPQTSTVVNIEQNDHSINKKIHKQVQL